MNQNHGTDPFEAAGSGHPDPVASAGAGQQGQVPFFDINNRTNPPDYSYQNSFNAAYTGAGMPYQSYGNTYGAGYPTYGTPYGGAYATGYNPGYGYSFNRQTYPTVGQLASNARETSSMVLSGVHNAMTRFARVSSMIEDVLRNLHMLFDAIFGLGYSLGAFRQELRLWLAIKEGPVGHIARFIRKASSMWKLLCIFFLSPLAGRFSPIAFVLRVLGLVPEDDLLESSLLAMWREREGEGGDDDHTGETFVPPDGPNL